MFPPNSAPDSLTPTNWSLPPLAEARAVLAAAVVDAALTSVEDGRRYVDGVELVWAGEVRSLRLTDADFSEIGFGGGIVETALGCTKLELTITDLDLLEARTRRLLAPIADDEKLCARDQELKDSGVGLGSTDTCDKMTVSTPLVEAASVFALDKRVGFEGSTETSELIIEKDCA